jgi:hypothetical protein
VLVSFNLSLRLWRELKPRILLWLMLVLSTTRLWLWWALKRTFQAGPLNTITSRSPFDPSLSLYLETGPRQCQKHFADGLVTLPLSRYSGSLSERSELLPPIHQEKGAERPEPLHPPFAIIDPRWSPGPSGLDNCAHGPTNRAITHFV